MAILVDIFLLAALATPAEPPASAPKPPQVFSPYSTVTGQFSLGIDKDSMKVIADGSISMVLLDIEIVMDRPVKYIDSPILVKSYQNTLSVDCANDRVFVLVSRAFNSKRTMIYSTKNVQIVNNPHDKLSPTSQVMQLICPAGEDRNTVPPGVTSHRDIIV